MYKDLYKYDPNGHNLIMNYPEINYFIEREKEFFKSSLNIYNYAVESCNELIELINTELKR